MTQALHALLSDAGIAVPAGLVNPGLEAITTDSRCGSTCLECLGPERSPIDLLPWKPKEETPRPNPA